MDINYILLIVAGGSLLIGALIMLTGIIVGGRLVFRAAGGEGSLLIEKDHPEIVNEADEDEDDEPEIVHDD